MPTFPGTVTPAVWLDGSQQAYSDSAGLVPVSAGFIRRINEPSPLTASWLSPSDDERPLAEAGAVRFEIQGPAGGNELIRTGASGVSSTACTLLFTFVARDNAFAGPQVGLCRSDDGRVGIALGSNQVWIYYNGFSIWFSPLTIAHGKRNTIAVRYTATGIDLAVNADGVVTTASTTLSISSATITADWRVAVTGTGYLYGSVGQFMAMARTVNDTERGDLIAWAHALPMADAYPIERPRLAFVGDSITRMTAADYGKGYPFLTLAAVRAAGYLAEVCDTAVGGTGVTQILDPGGIPNQTLLLRANAFYVPGGKNVMVIALGTNDLANNNSVAYILNGTGATGPAAGTTGLYPAIDYAVANGWKVVVVTPGPRTDTMVVSQATYDARRTQVCDDLVAHATAHGYRVVDTRGIANYGGPTDSNNLTYYSADKVHPVNAGHALLAPYVATEVLAALAAPSSPTPSTPPAPQFFRVFQHLLPRAKAWRLAFASTLRKFFLGLSDQPAATKDYIDDVYLDLFPSTTRELNEWERQFGLPLTDTTSSPAVVAGRIALAAEWAATGGQSPSYIQGVLRAAGFDVYVHEWWASGPPYVARDPRDYTEQPLIGLYQCTGVAFRYSSQPECSDLATQPQCNGFLANDTHYLVNLDLTRRPPPRVPDDPVTWPYFLYIGGATFPSLAVIDATRRAEFERLVLKLRPTHNWIVTLVNWPPEGAMTFDDGSFVVFDDGSYVT